MAPVLPSTSEAGRRLYSLSRGGVQHEPAIKAALPALSHGELPSVDSLRKHLPDLKVRVMNVVDLMTLQPQSEYPNGLSGAESDMTVRHELDRFSLVRDVIDLREHGDEIPMVEDRTWGDCGDACK